MELLSTTYRAVVVRSDDPEGLQRIQVQVPQVFADQITDWIWPQAMPGSRLVPRAGDTVWVVFEAGDPDRPVWVGVWHTQGGPSGSLSVPEQIYVGVDAPPVLPASPGLSLPTTAVQETAPGTTTVSATMFATTGAAAVGGAFSAPSAAVAGNATVGGTFGVTGNATVGGTFGVTGATTLGATTLGATTINGNANVSGQMTAGTVSATTYLNLPPGLALDTASGDITTSHPGDAGNAGSRGLAAEADHRHAREAWGTVGQISTSEPHDAAAAGAVGATCDAGHQHARSLNEIIYLGSGATATAGLSSFPKGNTGNSGGGHGGTAWWPLLANINATVVAISKKLASTLLIVRWGVTFWEDPSGGVGQINFRVCAGPTAGTLGQVGTGHSLYANSTSKYAVSATSEISGVGAGSQNVWLEVYTGNLPGTSTFNVDSNDFMFMEVEEA